MRRIEESRSKGEDSVEGERRDKEKRGDEHGEGEGRRGDGKTIG